MLVLRKELKLGIGAGLTILGIAGVYGLMASLSSSGDHSKDVAADVSPNELSDRQKAIASASDGLPPKADEVVPAPTPKADTPKAGDPFAENQRTDGNKADVWNSALTTGKITSDTKPSGMNGGATVVKAPAPVRPEGKLVRLPAAYSDPTTPGDVAIAPPPGGRTKPTPSTEPPVAGSKYVIQSGDTFSTIAAKVYGSKKYYNVLAKANPEINPSRMKVGHEITVPPKDAVATIGGAIENDTRLSTPIDATRQYRVAPGDTLSHISQKLYGKSTMWQAIYESNKTTIGPNEAKLKVGTLLDLPQKPLR